ncbi:MAG TPA: MFS transporter [Candidatus Dormibacteraeota bacterium]|nr:MFS transporter [Candidatus Dormibacteraeota bacterium]
MRLPDVNRDLALILGARLLRAWAFGMSAVLIGLHLERRGLSSTAIGLVLTIGLLSAAIGGVIGAALSSRIGRRRTLALAGGLMALAGLDLAVATSPLALALAAATGMLGAANVDFGAYASIEQAALAESVPPRSRNLAFARYSLTGGLAAALGALVAGGATSVERGQFLFAGYATAGALTSLLAVLLSPAAESPVGGTALSVTQVRSLAPLSALFALDGFGGGLVANSVIAFWLHVRFGAGANLLGPAFAVIALLQAASYEVSGRLANRIGLIRTMVFTHMPSNVLLALVPLAPSLPWAIGILFARFSLSQMDVPARQAFVVSIVPPSERAGAVAFTGLVRGLGQAAGPLISGAAIQSAALGLPFYLAGGLKLVYDGTLFLAFRQRRGEHEIIG